jgi:hyaluronoglucosaminidase
VNSRTDFRLGVIEGFFGRQWSWQARHDYAGFLSSIGCNSYIYAPKGDVWFRKQWEQPCPTDHLKQLSTLSAHYRHSGVEFGIGLSPFELYLDFSPARKAALAAKLEQINHINPSTLCILFDDMMGDLHHLADIQAEIMDFVCTVSTAGKFVLCPTYYTYDPILVRHFGEKPDNYLEDLGRLLDPAIDIFWTGPKVFSENLPRAHLEEIGGKLRRKPLIWDNYPVNDAKRLTGFLHLSPFSGRESHIRELCSGHLANPMNEAYLSQIPLYSLPLIYNAQTQPADLLRKSCEKLCPAPLAELLMRDAGLFGAHGLDSLDENSKQQLIISYAAFTDQPVACEVVDWLQGGYAFDPNCLT